MFCEGVLVEACLFIVFLDASIFPTTMVLEQEKQRNVGFVSSVIWLCDVATEVYIVEVVDLIVTGTAKVEKDWDFVVVVAVV